MCKMLHSTPAEEYHRKSFDSLAILSTFTMPNAGQAAMEHRDKHRSVLRV
jgi:hypothetical protein